MKKLMVAVAVAGTMAFGAYADSSRSITVTAYNRGTDGVVESVDLAFGECADDYVGDLYVAYGYTAGDGATPTNGWDHYEQLSDAITAEVTSYHYDMPEGWSEAYYHLKFFLFTTRKGIQSIKDYYVPTGLIAMFDGEDNAGTGVHDANAATWVDLTGNGYDIPVADEMGGQLDCWGEKSLKAKDCYNVPLVKSCEDYVTIEIVAKHDNAYQVLFNSGDGLKKFVAVMNGTIQFYNAGNQNFPIGNSTYLQAAAVYSPNAASPVVYVDGQAVSQSANDTWGGNNAGTCLGRGVSGSYNFKGEYYAIRLYDRGLSAAEIAANSLVDRARFFGVGGLPSAGESVYVLSGTSELIKRDAYVTLKLDQLGGATELDVTARLTLGGFDLGTRPFDIYAVLDDGTEQCVATNVKTGDAVEVKVNGLAPGEMYVVRFYAKDEVLSSPMTEGCSFGTPKVVIHPAQKTEDGRAIVVKGYKTKKGHITGVDLAFGACPDDWQGDLYVVYGPRSGEDMAPDGWMKCEKVSNEPFAAGDKTFRYNVPEGWRETVWSLRFFFKTRATKFLNASSYYIQDGLIAMWDGIDNAGVGTNVPSATVWKDLVGANDMTFNDRISFQANAIVCTEAQREIGIPDGEAKYALDLSTDLTYEIVYKQTGGSCIATIQNQFGNLYLWNENGNENESGWTEFADKDANVTRLPFPGFGEIVHNSVAVSGYKNITAYLDGVDAGYFASDFWYAGLKPSIFSENNSDNKNRGATGEIYTFRIYDRKLTAEEVAQNYQVDCIRYKGAQGELVIRTGRFVITSSSETIYAGKMMGGLIFLIALK